MSKLLLTVIAVALIRMPPSMTPETDCGAETQAVARVDRRHVCGPHLD